MPGDAAHQGRGDADADGRRDKVMNGQGDHLRQIAHGRFAAVTLPVGIGGEAGGGIEGEMLGESRELLRIERQHRLQPEDGVGEEHGHEAEDQHGDGVAFPIVFLRGINPDELIGKALEGLDHGIQEGFPVRIEHSAKVEAKRFGDRQQNADVKNELSPTGAIHG